MRAAKCRWPVAGAPAGLQVSLHAGEPSGPGSRSSTRARMTASTPPRSGAFIARVSRSTAHDDGHAGGRSRSNRATAFPKRSMREDQVLVSAGAESRSRSAPSSPTCRLRGRCMRMRITGACGCSFTNRSCGRAASCRARPIPRLVHGRHVMTPSPIPALGCAQAEHGTSI